MLHDPEELPDIVKDVLFDFEEIDTSEIEGLDDTDTYSAIGFYDEIVNRKLKHEGFFIKLAVPIPRYGEHATDKDSCMFSWGYYATQWFYLKDINELEATADSYQESILTRYYQEHLKKHESKAN